MRYLTLLLLLCSLHLASCDREDDCASTAFAGICPRSNFVGTWFGKQTVTTYRADTIFSEYAFEATYEFFVDGSVTIPFFGNRQTGEWYWLADSSKLLIYIPYQEIRQDSVTIITLPSVYDNVVSRCSSTELWFENSTDASGISPDDLYVRSVRLEKVL